MIPNADMGPLYKFDSLSEVHKINFILDSGKSYHQDRQISINLFSFQLSKLEIVPEKSEPWPLSSPAGHPKSPISPCLQIRCL